MRSAQMPCSMQRSFESEQGRLAGDGAFWVIRTRNEQVEREARRLHEEWCQREVICR